MSRPKLLRVAVVGLLLLSCRADPDVEADQAEVCPGVVGPRRAL